MAESTQQVVPGGRPGSSRAGAEVPHAAGDADAAAAAGAGVRLVHQAPADPMSSRCRRCSPPGCTSCPAACNTRCRHRPCRRHTDPHCGTGSTSCRWCRPAAGRTCPSPGQAGQKLSRHHRTRGRWCTPRRGPSQATSARRAAVSAVMLVAEALLAVLKALVVQFGALALVVLAAALAGHAPASGWVADAPVVQGAAVEVGATRRWPASTPPASVPASPNIEVPSTTQAPA